MKKILLILGMLITTIALYGMSAEASTFVVTKVIDVPGATKQQIMDKVSAWAKSYEQTAKVDAESGVITANGEIAYPSPPVDRIQYTIRYVMKNTVKGNTDTVTFEQVMLKSPTRYALESGEKILGNTKTLETDKDKAAATSRLTHVAENLKAYLLGTSMEAYPLVKCPQCPVLSPNSEELKEHMKTH